MHGVDGDTVNRIDRYRAAYDRADGAEEEQPESYAEVSALLFYEFVRLGRVAWAAMNPLRPLSSEILIEAGEAGTEALHNNIFPELRRFGQAILTRGDPARLGELIGLGEHTMQEQELFKEAMRRAANEDDVDDARRWARVFEGRLRMLRPEQRSKILTEFAAALSRD